MRLLQTYRSSAYVGYAFNTKKGKLKAVDIPFDLQPQVSSPADPSAKQHGQDSTQKFKLNLRSTESSISQKLKSCLKPVVDKKATLHNQSNIQSAYYEAQTKKLQENAKSRNFYREEYKKGENLLEKAPLDPYHEYRLAQLQNRVKDMKEQIRDFKNPQYNNIERALNIRKMAEGYDEKHRKSDYLQFISYLDEYPGTIKGATPEEDPQGYMEYALKKIPQFLLDKLEFQKKMEDETKAEMDRRGIGKKQAVYNMPTCQPLTHDRSLMLPEIEPDYGRMDYTHSTHEIPEYPRTKFIDYQSYWTRLQAWATFRYFYYCKNFNRMIRECFDEISMMERHYDTDPEEEYWVPEPAASSLIRYYRCLPKSLQENPGLKNIYLGLEYSVAGISPEQKEQMLNESARLCLPMDEVSTNVMQTFLSKKKTYLTPEIKDKIFSISPEYTWEIQKFLDELKEEKLRGSNIQERTDKYHTPPEVQHFCADDIPQLPIDYYENDDGFWDEHISKKFQRYDLAKPIMRVRKHFSH